VAVPYRPEHIEHFRTLASLRPPRAGRALAWLLAFGIAIAVVIMFTVPWVQTAPGNGQVVALNPDQRAQDVTAFVPGRLEQWYVQDGQLVRKGDPIARVVDLDPDLLSRLAAERAQVQAEIAATQQSRAVAQLDVARTRQLFNEGLAARRDFELAQIKVADAAAKLAESRAKLNRIDVQLRRQSAQLVRAPIDGRIQRINGEAGGTLVSAGTVLATIAPKEDQVQRAAEIWLCAPGVRGLARHPVQRLALDRAGPVRRAGARHRSDRGGQRAVPRDRRAAAGRPHLAEPELRASGRQGARLGAWRDGEGRL
jgi:multidrug efflux pump subunit AcrA (membrane-fusion protein)